MKNLRNVVVGLSMAMIFASGCVVEIVRGPYEGCKSGEACSNGTTCLPASYTSNGSPANFCSLSCTATEQCPLSPYGSGYAPTCVVSASAGGLCYDGCTRDTDCGPGTRCGSITGRDMNGQVVTAFLCMPLGTGTTACGASGQACCASSLCGSGLVCTAGVCAAPVVCGAAGQACCGGTTCNTGLACNAGACAVAVTPNRAAYAKCSATDVCATGTQCLTSIVAAGAAKTPGTSCTIACPGGLPSVCPGYVPGAATQSVTCLSVGTPAQSQCYRLCATQTDCTDFNTTCSAIPAAGGGTVSVCVPVGPRA